MKLFDDMTPTEKIDHCERCIKGAYEHLQAEHGPVFLASILDVWDYWTPYMVGRLRKLETVASAAQSLMAEDGAKEALAHYVCLQILADKLEALDA